jgi:hypothetical protein
VFISIATVSAEDGGVMQEIRRELEEEMKREQAEEAEVLLDQEVAAAAEAEAVREEGAKRRAAEAAAAAADAAAASQPSGQHENNARSKKGSFYRSTNVGAGSMRQAREERESVGLGSGGSGDRATHRSRVPRSSQPGGGGVEGGGGFGGGLGGGGGEGVGASFESMNEHLRKERSRAGTSGGNNGNEDNEEEEPEARRAARLALDDATRAAHHRAAIKVIKAANGGGGSDGSSGMGVDSDWYKVLGLRRGQAAAKPDGFGSKVKQEYRARALAVHPDKNYDPLAGHAFEVLQKAYEVLSDPAKRDAYDRHLVKRAKVKRQRVWRGLQHQLESLQGLASYGWKSASKRAGLGKSWKAILVLVIIFL